VRLPHRWVQRFAPLLAEAGCDRPTTSRIENAHHSPTFGRWFRLADAGF
jgi:hypothetical protein